jgi:hypothetical protein
VKGKAVISECGTYRYVLTRHIPQLIRWVRPCLFVMLNPSTADADVDDPTIRRCIGFARTWGCTELTVVNLFALRATDPKELTKHADPIGPDNDQHIEEQVEKHWSTGKIVAAWGAHPLAKPRSDWFRGQFGIVDCLGLTQAGAPRHPLYVPAKTEPRAMPEMPT